MINITVELLVNGQSRLKAGLDGLGTLTAALAIARMTPLEIGREEIGLEVTGVAIEGQQRDFLRWMSPELVVGDTIELRIAREPDFHLPSRSDLSKWEQE